MSDTASPSLPLWACASLAAVAGVLLAAGYALHPLWWAPWLAPVPLILAGRGSAWHATWTGAVAGALAMASVMTYYAGLMPWPIIVVFFVLRTLLWAGLARAARSAGERLPLPLAALVLPAMAAGLEWLTMTLSPHGAAGSLAYSQSDLPAVIQVAAVGGVPAVAFVMLLPGSLAGLILSRARPLAETAIAVGITAVGAVGLALWSGQRLAAPAPARSIPAVMVASDRFPGIAEEWAAVWAVYEPVLAQQAPAGGLVVMPEKMAVLDDSAAKTAAHDLSTVAVARHATLVAGLEVRDKPLYHNRAVVAGPDGSVVWYDKQRLVPGLESRDAPGRTPLFFATGGRRQGVAICKDMHIPSIGRQYAGHVAVMTVPAWDFGDDGWMGARMTALRAVEGGYSIARSARHGFVGAYDSRGRVIAERASTDGVTVVRAELPVAGETTFYGRFGDIFGMVCLAGIVVLLVASRLQQKFTKS
ncbi:MAG: hypothetical protein JF615_02950 [Asticcacaulis sp.]|nr:hypothetical protein [Asticcacaulis sp.]